MYRNQEGYADPTAGAVMKKLMTEYNRKKRLDRRRKAQRAKNRQKRAGIPKREPRKVKQDDSV